MDYLLYDDQELVPEKFKLANEFNKEAAKQSVEASCDAIWVSDDLSDSQRGFLR